MSRSSTSRRRLPRGHSAGLFIGRDGAAFALLRAQSSQWRLVASESVGFDAQMFRAKPQPQSIAELREKIGRCAQQAQRRHVPLHVLMPDPAVHSLAFELDQVPANSKALTQLVEHRMTKELAVEPGASFAQPLGRSEGRQLLLGMSMDKDWRTATLDVCAGAQLVPWSLAPVACCAFNMIHDEATQQSGALVTVTPDAWSLWVWDGEGAPRPLRSRWRTQATDAAEIVAEVERALIIYTDSHPQRDVESLHLYAAGEDGDALANLLDQRTHRPSRRWSWGDSVAGSQASAESATQCLALMAALAA